MPISSQGRTSFTKRQKELSRQEKQRDKAARKAQRKLEKPSGDPNDPDNFTVDESAAAEQWNFPGAGDDPQVP